MQPAEAVAPLWRAHSDSTLSLRRVRAEAEARLAGTGLLPAGGRKRPRLRRRSRHDLVSLGELAPRRRRERHSFDDSVFFDPSRAHRKPRLVMFHELRCFYDPAYRLYQVRQHLKELLRAADLGTVALFKSMDADGSGAVDRAELGAAVGRLGLSIKAMEVDALFSQLDADADGSVDVDEFHDWLFTPGGGWCAELLRRDADDPQRNSALLRRDSLRFDPTVRRLLRAFWKLCDHDGSALVERNEYMDLHAHLYAAMNVEAVLGDERGWRRRAEAAAVREWEFDSQGRGALDARLFTTSLFQLVDAWRTSLDSHAATSGVFCKALCFIMDRLADFSGGGLVKWKWHLDTDWLRQLEPLEDIFERAQIDVADFDRSLARGAAKIDWLTPAPKGGDGAASAAHGDASGEFGSPASKDGMGSSGWLRAQTSRRSLDALAGIVGPGEEAHDDEYDDDDDEEPCSRRAADERPASPGGRRRRANRTSRSNSLDRPPSTTSDRDAAVLTAHGAALAPNGAALAPNGAVLAPLGKAAAIGVAAAALRQSVDGGPPSAQPRRGAGAGAAPATRAHGDARYDARDAAPTGGARADGAPTSGARADGAGAARFGGAARRGSRDGVLAVDDRAEHGGTLFHTLRYTGGAEDARDAPAQPASLDAEAPSDAPGGPRAAPGPAKPDRGPAELGPCDAAAGGVADAAADSRSAGYPACASADGMITSADVRAAFADGRTTSGIDRAASGIASISVSRRTASASSDDAPRPASSSDDAPRPCSVAARPTPDGEARHETLPTPMVRLSLDDPAHRRGSEPADASFDWCGAGGGRRGAALPRAGSATPRGGAARRRGAELPWDPDADCVALRVGNYGGGDASPGALTPGAGRRRTFGSGSPPPATRWAAAVLVPPPGRSAPPGRSPPPRARTAEPRPRAPPAGPAAARKAPRPVELPELLCCRPATAPAGRPATAPASLAASCVLGGAAAARAAGARLATAAPSLAAPSPGSAPHVLLSGDAPPPAWMLRLPSPAVAPAFGLGTSFDRRPFSTPEDRPALQLRRARRRINTTG